MTVVIAGGGLAGAAAACLLARDGRDVTLLERDVGPRDKICGEFLSSEAVGYLAGLGVDVAAMGAAPIHAMRLIHGRAVAETALPFVAAGLSRRVLDEALLRAAAAAGATVRRGVSVRGIAPGRVELVGETLTAPTLLLATGKHDLRGSPRTPGAEPEALVGYKMYYTLKPAQTTALRGYVEIILFDGGYAGLQMIEGGAANLCLLVHRRRLDAAGGWPALLDALCRDSEHLAARLRGATPLLERPLTIFRVPYGYVHSAAGAGGVFRLGDQAAVIPSFCGDGMSIALHSAHRAAQVLRAGGDADAYHAQMRCDVGAPVRLAFGLYRATRSAVARTAMVAACRRWPGLMRAVATRTRVPDAALAATA